MPKFQVIVTRDTTESTFVTIEAADRAFSDALQNK
jgi:hypothetical protein